MLIVLNNKCNLNKDEYNDYLSEISKVKTNHQIVICPSSIYLSMKKTNEIILGAQNVSKYEVGSHTGEVSATQLKSLGIEYAIVGHHERRRDFAETKEDIKQKINNLIKEGISPILCIGETKDQRQNNNYINILLTELDFVTNTLSEQEKEKIVIAYEPVWCIGTGHIPNTDEIYEVVETIKKYYPQNNVLYGGGINETNINSLKGLTNINGYLFGESSLVPQKIQKFINILEN